MRKATVELWEYRTEVIGDTSQGVDTRETEAQRKSPPESQDEETAGSILEPRCSANISWWKQRKCARMKGWGERSKGIMGNRVMSGPEQVWENWNTPLFSPGSTTHTLSQAALQPRWLEVTEPHKAFLPQKPCTPWCPTLKGPSSVLLLPTQLGVPEPS